MSTEIALTNEEPTTIGNYTLGIKLPKKPCL